jgi:hypothetical protein
MHILNVIIFQDVTSKIRSVEVFRMLNKKQLGMYDVGSHHIS